MPPERTCCQVARKSPLFQQEWREMSTYVLMLHVLQQHELSVRSLGEDLRLERAAELLDRHFLPCLLVDG